MSQSVADTAPQLSPEDQGRANLYALLARLFSAGPDQALLDALASDADAIEGDGDLARAWRALCREAARTEAREAGLDFDAVFVGVGKAPVTTYLSHYMPVRRKDAVLVELRESLAALGVARRASSAEPEDNLATLLETMRHLVLAGSDPESLQRQRGFFDRYLRPGYPGFCDAAQQSSIGAIHIGAFHRSVVALLKSFLDADVKQYEMA